MASNWVDFKVVKQAVTLEMVFGHYYIDWLRKKGGELRGRCPIHKGQGENTFSADTEKNAFQCFSCGKHGNVLDFVAAMEQCTVRDAAVKLAKWFSVGGDAAQPAPVIEPTTGPPLAQKEKVGDRERYRQPIHRWHLSLRESIRIICT